MKRRPLLILLASALPFGLAVWALQLSSWRPHLLRAHRGSQSVAFAPDGKTLVGVSNSGEVSLWNVSNRRLQSSFKINSNVESVAFSADGANITMGTSSDMIEVAQVATGKALKLWGHPGWQSKIFFAPQGGYLLNSYGKVWRWNGRSNTFPLLYQVKPSVGCSCFAPDGQSIVGLDRNGTVYFWPLHQTRPVRTISLPHRAVPTTMALSPDGSILAVGYVDEAKIKLWNTTTGRLMRELNSPAHRTGSVAFSPSGRVLATGNTNGMIVLWRVK